MKTFTLLTSAALASLLALAVSTANAAGEAMPGSGSGGNPLSPAQQREFEKLDTNHDGKISQEEAQADPELAKKFASLDKNNNGELDQAEFAQFEARPESGQNQEQNQNQPQ